MFSPNTVVPPTISIAEAREIIAANVKPGRMETVPLLEATGRVAAADLRSDIDVCPFDDSGMDGYALIAADLADATAEHPVQLECVAWICAGDYFDGTLEPGQCARIMTGAPVPAGADAVVKIELVTYEGDGTQGCTISFTEPVKVGKNIRPKGEEAKAGEVVIPAGELIRTAGIGVLASTGNNEVPVFARPKVGIITIGSELVDSTEVPVRGQIRDSNRWAMAAYIKAAGGVPCFYPRVADTYEDIKALFAQAVAECDMVVSTGGACLGDFDLTPAVLADLGTILYSRISMKPGKSQPFGLIDGKPVFILSGNPGASSVGFEMFVRPALRIMQGYTVLDRPHIVATLEEAVPKDEKRVFLQRGILYRAENGGVRVKLCKNQSSALFGSLQQANCLIWIPEGKEGKQPGDKVDCIIISMDETDSF